MKKSLQATVVAGVGALSLLGVGIGLTQVANADTTETPSPAATATDAPDNGNGVQARDGDCDGTGPRGDRGNRGERGPGQGRGPGGANFSEFANELGITQDQLRDAMDEARIAGLAEALDMDHAKVQEAWDASHPNQG